MMYKFRYLILFTQLTFLQVLSGFSQTEILDDYVAVGIENNLALKQKISGWEEAGYALKAARGLFFPDISLNARYTVADGGRMIEFPVGDLLNPVYSTLNMLTGSNSFPVVENMQFPFLRPTEQETKIRLVQPVLNADIYYNHKILEKAGEASRYDMEAYRRNLVFEIRKAYFEYSSLAELKQLFLDTRKLLEENLRVNESLVANQKLTRDALLRSQTEILELDGKLAGLNKDIQLAKSYFNFLLNRDFNEEIIGSGTRIPEIPLSAEMVINEGLSGREELAALDAMIGMAENNLKRNTSSIIPEIYTVIDYGIQGEDYRFGPGDDYFLASAVLQWNIFRAFQDKNKTEQSRINLDRLRQQKEEAELKIRLEILQSWYSLTESAEKLKTAGARLEAEQEVFRIIERKYLQNQVSQLEYLAARNSMTRAGQELIISRYSLMIEAAGLERVCGINLYDGNKIK